MEKFKNFSERGVFASCMLTTIIAIVLWMITKNVVVLIGSALVSAWAMTKLFHKDVTKKGKILVFILLIILFALCCIFLKSAKNDELAPAVENQEIVVDDSQDEDVTNDEAEDGDQGTVIVDNSANSTKKSTGSRYGNAKPTADEIISTSYSNIGGDSSGKSASQGVVSIIGNDKINIDFENGEDKQDAEIQKDVESGKDVVNLDKGITATIDNTPQKEEEKDDSKKVDLEGDKENAVTVPSSDEAEKIPDPLPDNEQLKEDVEIPDGDQLDDMVENTQPEETGKDVTDDTTTDKKDESSNGDKQDESTTAPTESEDKQDGVIGNDSDLDEKVEETKPSETVSTPVSIESIDGSSATAGDTVQFRVTGEVKSVEGLNGLDYTFTNGYISVNTTPGVATVISPVVIGVDGVSTATASVTVNVLN